MKSRFLILLIIVTSMSFAFSCSSSGGSSGSLKVSPTSHTYGTVAVPNYEDYSYVISNNTSETINLSSAQFTGANSSDFYIVSGAVPYTLYPDSELTMKIRFQPSSKGNKVAVLEIKHNKPNLNSLFISLRGTGLTTPAIDVTPTSRDFGSMWIMGKLSQEFTIKSTGTETLVISGLSITGSNASEFTFTSMPTIPLNINPNGTAKFTVEWTSGNPVASKSASVNIVHNAAGTTTVLPLSGTSVPYVPLDITTGSIGDGTVWQAYNEQLQFTGGNGNQEFSVLTGDFPAGLDLNKTTGEITGKPAYPGIYSFKIQVDDQISQDAESYKIEIDKDGSWNDVTPSGFQVNPRCAVANYNFDLYFFGGSSGGNGSNTIKLFDTKNNTFKNVNANLISARERSIAATVGKYIYIMGGRSNSYYNGSTIGTVERFDVEAQKIYSDAYMPNSGQYNTTGGIHNGKIYILGGASPNETKVYEFTPGASGTSGSWTTKADLDYGYTGMGFVSYNSLMYLVGGYYYAYINEVREYDPATGVNGTAVGLTIKPTGRMQYGFITDSIYMVDNGDNLQKFNFVTFSGHSAAYPNCPISTMEIYTSQNVECMGRIYVTEGDTTNFTPMTQIYAYTP